MVKITFKDVGQGDTILIEWDSQGELHFGIIDCNLYNDQNPALDEIKSRGLSKIDFIILSHLHHDHYSGFGDLLEYCVLNNIEIKQFLHTFENEFFYILNKLYTSQKKQKDTDKFLEYLWIASDKDIIKELYPVTYKTKPIKLTDGVKMRFFAPNGKDALTLARKRVSKETGQTTTAPDMNVMSTIINVTNGVDTDILLTADAVKSSFKRISGLMGGKIFSLIQVPHHGSNNNLEKNFWLKVSKVSDCPAVFSVGDVKKDKLPNKDVVEFFDTQGFKNTSTNFVYGIQEFYKPAMKPMSTTKGSSLSLFFPSKKPTSVGTGNTQFIGDQTFTFNI